MMEWVTCPSCGHKLFRTTGNSIIAGYCMVEIKCSSCKQIVQVNILRDTHIKKVYKREGRKS